MYIADLLSQNTLVGFVVITPMLANRRLSQINSFISIAKDRYSASADKQLTVGCFLVFHEIG